MCFGALEMTAEEIYNSTPWEIKRRIKGYEDRQRYKRLLLAQLVSLPVYNSGFSRPKMGVQLQDVLPPEDLKEDVTQDEIDRWRKLLAEAKNGRYNEEDKC